MSWMPEDDARIEQMKKLLAAVGYLDHDVFLDDLPEGLDGFTGHEAMFSGEWRPYAIVARRLNNPEGEATVLHEAAHWRLGHEEADSVYEAARLADEAEGRDYHRGPQERAVNHLASSWIRELIGTGLVTDPAESLRFLDEDDARFAGGTGPQP